MYSFAVMRLIHTKHILPLIYGVHRHHRGRGHAPQWNTSQNVAIQESFLFSVDYLLQQTPTTNPNAARQAIPASVAPNAISNEHLQ